MCGTNGCASSGASWDMATVRPAITPPGTITRTQCRGRHCAHDTECFYRVVNYNTHTGSM